MPDAENESRVAALAAAAGITIAPGAAARIAGIVGSVNSALRDEASRMPFETEPATFVAVQLRDIAR